MHIINEKQYDFSDVLLKPKRSTLSSRKEVNIERNYTFKWSNNKLSCTGILAANMSTTGTFEVAKVMCDNNLITALHKHYSAKEIIKFLKTNKRNDLIFISTGVSDDDYNKIKEILDTKLVNNICVDIANGYTQILKEFVSKLRFDYPESVIMAGNVVTGDMTEDLILSGADIVKIGIGPGAVCTTRRLTGVGRPQLSAIIECADAAHGVGGMICADGGCQTPGDVAKSFGGGSDFVMLGALLAGHEECGGDLIIKQIETNEIKDNKKVLKEEKYKSYYGMSSQYAQEKFYGGLKDYRASEGKYVELPYRGNINNTISEILGGLRSTMTYIGARKLKDIPKCATFYIVNRQLNTIYEQHVK
jgi:IMP dehydrogenase/GMP reductase